MPGWIDDRVDAVIFDHDGTLVDSETVTLTLLATMANELGADFSYGDIEHLMGSDIKLVIAAIEQRRGEPVNHADFFDDFRERQSKELGSGVDEIPGAASLLQDLEARQVPVAVASNAPRAKVDLCLGVTGLDRFFTAQCRFSAYDINIWKPDPALFLVAADHFGVPIERCAIVEDSPPGIAGAVASGAHVIALNIHGAGDIEGAHNVRSLREASELLLGST